MGKAKSPFIIENLEEDTGFLLLQTSRLWEKYHEKSLKKYHNLSHIQYAVLASTYWLILNSNKEVNQTILAKHTKIDPMTISQIFKVLERKGYISRKRHSTDPRSKVVSLTPEGEELVRKAVATVVDVDNKFFKVLGKHIPRFNRCLVELLNAND